MDKLAQDFQSNFDVALEARFNERVAYHRGMDFIEYVAVDGFVVAGRIDELLTVLVDGDSGELVGFKLKGFACIYNEYIKPMLGSNEPSFLADVIPALLSLVDDIGGQALGEDAKRKRAKAYMDIAQLARSENIQFDTSDLPRVA